MTSNEALQLLDQAVALLKANRETHTKLQQAVLVLRRELSPKAVVPPDKKEEKVDKK